jgi:hypothetical protein
MLNEDYRDILRILSKNRVDFLVVGAYAMSAYGYPRATGDIDIWVLPSQENSRKVYISLAEFGAPVKDITEETFLEHNIVYQIGVAPRRIDVLTHIDGVDFQNALENKRVIELEGLTIPIISKEELLKNKQATGREKDRLDALHLLNNTEN